MHNPPYDLRAYLDQALPAADQAAAARHLAECAECRAQLDAVSGRAGRVSARLAALAPLPGEASPSAAALRHQIELRSRKDYPSMLRSLVSKRPVWLAAAAVLVLALSFSFAPVRIWAGQFLGLFRVQQIEVLPLDVTQLDRLSSDPTLSQQLSQLFSDSVHISREPGPVAETASADEASQQAGFGVRVLSAAQGSPRFMVSSGPAFEAVIDRAKAQALLDAAGRSDLQLPASVDGATVKVDVATGVTVAYGDCPKSAPGAMNDSPDPDNVTLARNCVMLAQVPSPSVVTPPDLDMGQLAELGLQLAGMSAAEAHSFSQTIDWTSTLVVPIPRNAAAYAKVNVDGVTGTVIYRRYGEGRAQEYTLLWVKNGIVYALAGYGTTDQAAALANSIQ
jgi:hypothetical protein